MKRRQNVLIILFVIAVMAVYTGYEANKPQPIDWSPNFSISKKSPYGTYIIKDALPYLFPEGEVSFARMSVREQLRVGRTPFLLFRESLFQNCSGGFGGRVGRGGRRWFAFRVGRVYSRYIVFLRGCFRNEKDSEREGLFARL